MLEVSHISRSFGAHQVLRDVSFSLAEHSICGLIGPSGGGKSILFKILGGIIPADSGSLKLDLKDPKEISLMFQAGALFDSISVLDNVAFPLVDGAVPIARLPYAQRSEVTAKVSDILARVGLSKHAMKMPAQLSGGMKRRVSLARALVARPKFVLLDDPTYGLDPVASSIINELIKDLHAEYSPTMLIISQDLRRLLPMVDKIMALFNGKIIFDGTVPELVRTEDKELRHFVSCRYDLGATSNQGAASH